MTCNIDGKVNEIVIVVLWMNIAERKIRGVRQVFENIITLFS